MIGSKFLVAKRAPILSASGVTKHAEDEDHTLRNVGMGAAFAYPFAVGLINNRGVVPEAASKTQDFKKFLAQVRPGDILASGAVDYYPVKGAIAAISNRPDLYHIQTVLDSTPMNQMSRYQDNVYEGTAKVPRKFGRRVTIGHATGEGNVNEMYNITKGNDADNWRILRPKDENHARRIIEHIENAYKDKSIFYSGGQGKKSGLKEMLIPNLFRKPSGLEGLDESALAARGMEDLRCSGGLCSNLPATALPEIWDKPSGEVLPNDLLTSKHFDHIADYTPTREVALRKTIEDIKKAKPHLSDRAVEQAAKRRLSRWALYDRAAGSRAHLYTRAALGLGGAGLVAAASRIPSSDLSLGEGLAGAGLLAAPIASSLFNQRATEDKATKYLTDTIRRKNNAIDALVDSGLSRAKAVKQVEGAAKREILDYIKSEGLKIPGKNISVVADAIDPQRDYAWTFGEIADSSRFNPTSKSLEVIPDRVMYLRELGRAKHLAENPSRAVDWANLPKSNKHFSALMEELASHKNALNYVYGKEGLGAALGHARQAMPSITPYINNVLKMKSVSRALKGSGLAGLGILGSQLYKDKEQSALDRLKSALGMEV